MALIPMLVGRAAMIAMGLVVGRGELGGEKSKKR
jgi:hypothetical protein